MNSLCDNMAREDSPLVSVHLEHNLIERRLIPPTAFSCIKTYHSVILRPQRYEELQEWNPFFKLMYRTSHWRSIELFCLIFIVINQNFERDHVKMIQVIFTLERYIVCRCCGLHTVCTQFWYKLLEPFVVWHLIQLCSCPFVHIVVVCFCTVTWCYVPFIFITLVVFVW